MSCTQGSLLWSSNVFKESTPRQILSSSRNVRYLCVYMSPPHVIFFKASHWPSDQIINARPLIGQPSFSTLTHLNPYHPIPTHLKRNIFIYFCQTPLRRRGFGGGFGGGCSGDGGQPSFSTLTHHNLFQPISIHLKKIYIYKYISKIRHKDYLCLSVCPSVRPSVTLRVPPLKSETGWTGELWSKTNLLNCQN